jgi:RNA polymerase sigma factor (sigma-70 family)
MSIVAPNDCELIEKFLTGEGCDAEAAFGALVKRHGPMVRQACLHVLKRPHDADDAVQETFLALARKAGTIRHRPALGRWLHQVAYRTALRMRTRHVREHSLESISNSAVSAEEAGAEAARKELVPILLSEIDRMPAMYRSLLVQCHLEGKTNEEAARLLGHPVGTVKGRLWRARALLRQQLKGTGLSLDHVERPSRHTSVNHNRLRYRDI